MFANIEKSGQREIVVLSLDERGGEVYPITDAQKRLIEAIYSAADEYINLAEKARTGGTITLGGLTFRATERDVLFLMSGRIADLASRVAREADRMSRGLAADLRNAAELMIRTGCSIGRPELAETGSNLYEAARTVYNAGDPAYAK